MRTSEIDSAEAKAARRNLLDQKIASVTDVRLRKKYEEYVDSLVILMTRIADHDIRNKPSTYASLYKLIKFDIKDEKNILGLLPSDIWQAYEEDAIKNRDGF